MADFFQSQFDHQMGGMDPMGADQTAGGGGGGGTGNGAALNAEEIGKQNTVHVTLAHVAKFTRQEEGLVMFRQKIHSILVIGVLANVEELTTKNIYSIEDYSMDSTLDVQFWKNEEGAEVPPSVMEQSYVRVIGQARYDDNKPFIVAFRIQPIEDPNEIFCHFLEVLHDSFILEKRLNATLNAPPPGAETAMGGTGFEAAGSINNGDRIMPGFTEIQQAVLNVLKRYGRDSTFGLKRDEIRTYMTGVNVKIIDDALTFLVNEGHIFSTTDEDTFKCTDF